MKVTLKNVNNKLFIEFIKQFKGFSTNLFLEFIDGVIRSRVSAQSKIRLSNISAIDIYESDNQNINFRATFYNLGKIVTALSFEDNVDLVFDLEEREDSLMYAKNMQIKGKKIKLNIPCADIKLNYVYLSDKIVETVLFIPNPIEFNISGELIKTIKNITGYLGDVKYEIMCGSSGVKIKCSDGEIIIDDESKDTTLNICFSVDDLGELSTTNNYKCSLGANKIIFIDQDETITVFAQLVGGD